MNQIALQPEGLRQEDPDQDRPRRRRRIDQQAVRTVVARRRYPRCYARPSPRPHCPQGRDAHPGPLPRSRRSRPDAGPRLHPRPAQDFQTGAEEPPDAAVFGHHAEGDRRSVSRIYWSNPKRVEVSPPGKAADKVEQFVHFRPGRQPEDRNPQEDADRKSGWPRHGLFAHQAWRRKADEASGTCRLLRRLDPRQQEPGPARTCAEGFP